MDATASRSLDQRYSKLHFIPEFVFEPAELNKGALIAGNFQRIGFVQTRAVFMLASLPQPFSMHGKMYTMNNQILFLAAILALFLELAGCANPYHPDYKPTSNFPAQPPVSPMATAVKLTAALGSSQGWRDHMVYKPVSGPSLLCKYRDNRDAQVVSSSGVTVETIILKLNCDTGPETISWADSQYIRQTQPAYLGNAYSGATWAAAYLYQLSFIPPEPSGYFEGEVKKYRDAETKPNLPESVREFKVRAESAVAEKRFVDAVEAYDRALQIAPWWAEGHFNVALILGELKVYGLAIEEMERYLLLAPEATDARQAQDRIYTWKGRL